MGKLSGRNYDVTAITFRIRSQATGERFTVPKAIAEELDFWRRQTDWHDSAKRRRAAL